MIAISRPIRFLFSSKKLRRASGVIGAQQNVLPGFVKRCALTKPRFWSGTGTYGSALSDTWHLASGTGTVYIVISPESPRIYLVIGDQTQMVRKPRDVSDDESREQPFPIINLTQHSSVPLAQGRQWLAYQQ